jgi:catechol 2,3-dioxygenase-like lactoylglutathione lyase family enzyme
MSQPMVVRAAVLAALLGAASGAQAQAVSGIQSVAMTVTDVEASRDFYVGVLGFRVVGEQELSGDAVEHLYHVFGARIRAMTLQLGDERLELDQFIAPAGRPFPADSKSNDRWFQHVAIIVSDMDQAFALLREHHVRFASSGPQLLPNWNKDAGGISAFYFRDPDGHYLEILHFPEDKGAKKWHATNGALFLGIDHTAIVVADTEASLRYYRDTLGMRVAGQSENYGPEQEHLNNVFGARLRITALRAATGPGVELLEYLSPGGGRPLPADTQANDIWHWSIQFAADVAAADQALRAAHFAEVSPGIVTGLNGLMVNDPDGHSSLLRQSRHP